MVRPSSLVSGTGDVVGASILDLVEKAVAWSSAVVDVEDSASQSLSVTTRWVMESVLKVELAGAPPVIDEYLLL